MKLVFLYGPPAAGKTTIGREVAERTGFRFFYNHLSIPVARAIFPRNQEPSVNKQGDELVQAIRLLCITAAAKEDTNLVFTLAYSGAVDNEWIAKVVQAVETQGGEVCFAELHATTEALKSRVADQSRQEMKKLIDPERLQHMLDTRDLLATVPYQNVCKIDTSTMPPATAASRIIEHFALPIASLPVAEK